MLTLTDSAAAMIARLREQSGASGDVALRIAKPFDTPGLQMTLAEHPDPDDLVLDDPRARVFLDPVAAVRLNDQVLDARSSESGSAFFLG